MYRALAVALLVLAFAASPALAADTTVQVGDDFFNPQEVQIDVGDTVTWEWVGAVGNHSVTSRQNQTESFDSDPGNNNPRHLPGSTPFTHTFTKNGATNYYCKLHPVTMQGTVTVGTLPPDASPPELELRRPGVGRRTVRVGFQVSEAARVVLRLSRASRPGRTIRTVAREVGTGDHTIVLRRRGLAPGRYVVRLTAEDATSNQSPVETVRFRLAPRRR